MEIKGEKRSEGGNRRLKMRRVVKWSRWQKMKEDTRNERKGRNLDV